MQKSRHFFSLALAAFTHCWIAAGAHALEFQEVSDFSDWNSFTDPDTQITVSGDSVRLDADSVVNNDGVFASINSPATAVDGVMATFNIADFTGNRFSSLEMRRTVGRAGNADIQARLRLTNGDDSQAITLRITQRSPDTGNQTEDLYRASFNRSWDDIPEWEIDQNITLLVARFGDEIWFFLQGHETVIKYHWLAPEPLERIESPIEFTVYAEGPDDSISGTVSHVYTVALNGTASDSKLILGALVRLAKKSHPSGPQKPL